MYKLKILIALKESAGDILLITGVIDSIKNKYPNSDLYVACNQQYWNILEENPYIRGVIEFDDSMYNYRAYTKWAMNDNLFDIVYAPAIQTQVVPGNWLNGAYAVYLGQFYANACNVEFGKTFIAESDISKFKLPEKYITTQSQSKQDPKNYDYMQEIVDKINIPIVHIGSNKDKKLDKVIDLTGKTTFREAATIIKLSQLHLGLDSVLMHFAEHFNVKSVILFGGTLPQAGVNPNSKNIHVIETQDRGPCGTSCHLIDCAAKDMGYDKCINNIPLEQVLEEVRNVLGNDYVENLEPITISAYTIIKDGVKHKFPFKEAVRAAAAVSDEVVVACHGSVGGQDDGTIKILGELQKEFHVDGEVNTIGRLPGCLLPNEHSKIKVDLHKWDMDNPTLFGDEKTYARQLCTGTHLIQFDCDELISEPKPGMIRKLVEKHRFDDVVDLPCINFYGDLNTIRIEPMCWKWRISKNDFNIIHGVNGDARQMDPETGRITMDKRVSDACEYIYADTLKIANHKLGFDPEMIKLHEQLKRSEIAKEEYIKKLEELVGNSPIIFHYSWLDLDRKTKNGEFWDRTWHGKKEVTHNTTKNITQRIANRSQELLLKVEFDHPFKQMQGAV